MTLRTKIYVCTGALAIIALAIAITSLRSGYRERELGRAVDAAKQNAERSEAAAVRSERQASEYKQKIDYLEDSLSALRQTASKQDEELKLLKNDTDRARDNAGRARAVRSLESTTAELCSRLAALGHPCD